MPASFEQQGAAPIYPKILWNRPLSRHGAGQFMVAGGHTTDFSLPTTLFSLIMAAGGGEVVAAMPDSLAKILGVNPSIVFVPSSLSGSIGREAVAQLINLAEDADALLLGATLSSNSETALVAERLLEETTLPLIAFDDAFTALQFHPNLITDRSPSLIVATMPELLKLANRLEIPLSIRRDGGLPNKLEIVTAVRAQIASDLAIYGTEIIIATESKRSVTPINPVLTRMPAAYYAVLAVFWLQHRKQTYEALTTGAWVLAQVGQNLVQQEKPTVAQVAKSISTAIDYEPNP